MKRSDDPNVVARAERLAAALRENLKRRKVQAKGRVAAPSHAAAATPTAAAPATAKDAPKGDDET